MTLKKYFGTDGIRGRVGVEPITPEFAMRLGRAAGRVLAAPSHGVVVLGKDTRRSGYMLEAALQAGLISAGADVRLLGPMPTPGVAFLTQSIGACAGVVISASHNPHHDNGFKFFSARGEKLSDDVEAAIEAALEHDPGIVVPERLGRAAVVVDMVYSEFGRRVAENTSLGTDHGTAGPAFVIGKPVIGGHYGRAPSLTDLDDGNLKYTTDYRQIYSTLIQGWMGVDQAATILKDDFSAIPMFASAA